MKMRKPGARRVFLSCRRRLLLAACGLLFLSLLLAALASSTPAAAAATGQQKDDALHGQPWAFGQSEDRKAAIWRRGVPAQTLKQRALDGAKAQSGKTAAGATAAAPKGGRAVSGKTAAGKGAPQKSVTRGSAPGQGAPGHGAMDTEGGIDHALAAAQAIADAEAAEAAKKDRKARGSLGLSMKNSTTTWNVTPMREAMRPDEVLVRDRHHVLRAFADVEPTEDLSIRVGPELILKDEQHGAESAGASQPDSALGLGMQFKLDF